MLNYLDQREHADQVAHRIRAKQGQAMIFQADVTQETQVRSMFDVLVAYWGTIDILVSNVGLELKAPLLEMSLEQSRQIICNHLTGLFLCARETTREFVRRGLRSELSNPTGKIIFVSTAPQPIYQTDDIHYAAYKSGMCFISNAMSSTRYKDNIRFDSLVSNGNQVETVEGTSNSPEAIVHAVIRLALDQSQTINRVNLTVAQALNLLQEFTAFSFQPDVLANQSNQGKL